MLTCCGNLGEQNVFVYMSLGVESLGVESLGVESLGVESLEPRISELREHLPVL